MKNPLPRLSRRNLFSLCARPRRARCRARLRAGLGQTILDKSPRHQEWVKVKYGSRTVDAFVVYPEVSHKAPVVLLIHEIFGLTDWARSMADDIAAMGYIVIAPDLLSGDGPNGGGTSAFPDQQAVDQGRLRARSRHRHRRPERRRRLRAQIPAANGKLAVIGFCWGGGKSFRFATQRKDLAPPSSSTALRRPPMR